MDILHVIPSLAIGGAENLVKELTLNSYSLDCRITILVFQRVDNYLSKALEKQNISIYFAPANKPYAIQHIAFLWSHLKRYQYDIIHAHLTPAQLFLAIVNTLKRKKLTLITTEHSTYNRRRKPLFKFLDRWLYNQFKVIACVNNATLNSLEQWLPIYKSKYITIPNGIDLKKFAPAPLKNVKRPSIRALSVLTIGRLVIAKNHDTTIRAIARLKGIHLFIAGDGPLKLELMQLAQQLGLRERIHFLGNCTNIPDLIHGADIYIQASKYEGLPLAIIEAMAGGLPIIASNATGLSDIISNIGLLFSAGDDEELAQRIHMLASKPSLRKQLSEKSKQRALDFSIHRTAQQYLNAYQKIKEYHAE